MLVLGNRPKQVFAMQLSVAVFTATFPSRCRDSGVGQNAITRLIFQTLYFLIKNLQKSKSETGDGLEARTRVTGSLKTQSLVHLHNHNAISYRSNTNNIWIQIASQYPDIFTGLLIILLYNNISEIFIRV